MPLPRGELEHHELELAGDRDARCAVVRDEAPGRITEGVGRGIQVVGLETQRGEAVQRVTRLHAVQRDAPVSRCVDRPVRLLHESDQPQRREQAPVSGNVGGVLHGTSDDHERSSF